jgi:two-component system OmpR family sensor kinase
MGPLRSFYRLFFILLGSIALSATVVVPVLHHLFVVRFDTTPDSDLSESLYTFRDRLSRVPPDQWQIYIDRFRAPLSLFPVALEPLARHPFSPTDARRLASGMTVTTGPGEVAVAMPGSPTLLKLRRIHYSVVTNAFNLLAWSIFSLILVLSIYGWLRGHWRDLGRLRGAAEAFGQGRLNGRVNLAKGSELGSLAACFDAMAGRIEVLVASQNDMINAISHELRTPIARCGFGLALLQSATADDQRKRHIEALKVDLEELDALVGELLSYGAIDRADRPHEIQEVRMSELLDSVVGSLALEMDFHRVRCTVDTPDAAALLDPRRTSRAVLNLLKNAMKYCQDEISLTAFIHGDSWVLQVDDNGIGIPPADRHVIFEPFHRLDRSRDRKTGGFGLGLSIASRAIVSQRGHIQVSESPLGGARFEITLPAAVPQRHQAMS